VVALTQSIERVFGSKVATPELGFLYNNYMSAFEYEDMTHPYYLRPNGVPWASVAPTIILRNKKPWMAIGSPGSERIASAILQVLLRLKYQSPFDAVAAPRIHCSYDGKVSLEAAYMRDDIPSELASRGFEIDVREPMSFYLGCIQMVLREGDDFVGVADPRRDGSAAGPKK
jgi:gamma-glutamyltranspeptidase/glutathione hydrolase